MYNNELPLQKIFERLRERGIFLSPDEYKLVLNALQGGFGISNFDALYNICRALWIKSPEDEQILLDCFKQTLEEDFEISSESNKLHESVELILDTPKSKLYYAIWGIVVAISSLGCFVLLSLLKDCPSFVSRPLKQTLVDQTYTYTAKVCKPSDKTEFEISVTHLPPWAQVTSQDRFSITISGTPKSLSKSGSLVSFKLDKKGEIDKTQAFMLKILPNNKSQNKDVDVDALAQQNPLSLEALLQSFLEPLRLALLESLLDRKFSILIIYFALLVSIISGVYTLTKKYYQVRKSQNRRHTNNIEIDNNSINRQTGLILPDLLKDNSIVYLRLQEQNKKRVEEPHFHSSKKVVDTLVDTKQLDFFIKSLNKKSLGNLKELDLLETVKRASQTVFFTEPIFRIATYRHSQSLVLIDCEGSMTPFEDITASLTYTLSKIWKINNRNFFYFHNVPDKSLYRDMYLINSLSIQDFIKYVCTPDKSILIFSDAGAGRGNYNENRLKKTKKFIEKISRKSKKVLWLNPYPKSRWQGTTAEHIQALLLMTELNIISNSL